MMLRALGIGPAGSLLASGKLSASDKVLVAAFDAPAADSSLGSTIAEAVRTNLSQSRAVHVMPTSAVVAALEQMKRPDTARVDFAIAREIAQRAGAKAVVAGSVVPAGSGLHRHGATRRSREWRRARVVSRVGEGCGRSHSVGGPPHEVAAREDRRVAQVRARCAAHSTR